MNKSHALTQILRQAAALLLTVAASCWIPVQARAAGEVNDYAEKLSHAPLFLQPLVWVGTNAPDSDETRELYEAAGLDPDHQPADRLASMEAFVRGYPNSSWVPSLRANLAAYYRTTGRYSTALEYWQQAWDATKDLSDPNSRKVADYTVAYWSGLLSSLGRIEKLQELIAAVNGRPLSNPEFQRLFNVSRQSAGIMQAQPGDSFRCGSMALYHVAHALDSKSSFSDIANLPSPSTGFSLAQLVELSQKHDLGLIAVKRPSGGELVVPSVIHWKENHYAALVGKQGASYRVIDPTFGRPQSLSAAAINENASGYFLVPTNRIPAKWQLVDTDEAKTVFGKGLENAGSVPPGPNCDSNGDPCTTGTCTNKCPEGGGTGGNGGGTGGNGGGTGGGSHGSPCAKGSCNGTVPIGMPDWEVREPYISLWLHDRPLFYNMSIGGQSFLQMDYHQREDEDERYAYSFGDFGPNWNCNLLTYIRVEGVVTNGSEPVTDCDETGTNCSTHYEPVNIGQLTATEYCPDGGQRSYQWGGPYTETTMDPRTHVQFVPSTANTSFSNAVSGGYFFGYAETYLSNKLVYPNGSVAVFNYVIPVSSYPPVSVALLTSSTDPHGRMMSYSYAFSGGNLVLSQVVDFDGKTNQFIYGNGSFPTSVTEVTNINYHLGADFKYDTNGRMTNITDMAGISSSFQYMFTNEVYYTNYDGSGHPVPIQTNSTWLLTRLKTPYGDTSFDYFHPTWPLFGQSPDNYINRAITVTQPDSGKQLFVYADKSTYEPSFMPYHTGNLGNPDFDTNYWAFIAKLGYVENTVDNSFYWGPRQYAALSSFTLTNLTATDFTAARLRNWLHSNPENTLGIGQILNVEEDFSPDGGATPGRSVYYAYDGKPHGAEGDGYIESTNEDLPSGFGYRLDASHTGEFYENISRNSNGYPTEVVEFGRNFDGAMLLRTNIYVYAANNVDLVKHIGPDGIVQEGYFYDGLHQVLAMTNALHEVTQYTYNTRGQLSSVTRPNNLVTTNIYGADGFLATTYDYSGSTYYRTNSYTYTNGLVFTHTDERGLTTTNTWTALQKLARMDYPDGTSINYTYTNLDLIRVVDRMGFTNSYAYDSMERRTGVTNALGNKTIYNYCNCGALDSIQDSLNNYTHFYYDAAGRLTNTVYADGYGTTNSYNMAGMLINVTSSSGKSLDYHYDGLLRKVAITGSPYDGIPVISASAYDVNDLITTETNANGVITSMTYDALHRLTSRTYPDTGVEHFGYTANIPGITSYTNQLGNVWIYGYDLLNRKTTEVALGMYTNSFVYAPAGDLLTLTDGKNQNTTWKYDMFGRVTNKVDNLGTSLFIYAYDADNRLTNRTSAAKGLTKYSYDAAGNLTLVDYPVSPDITLQYDAMNRLTNMVDAVGATRYAYDAAGQVLSEDGPWDNDTVSYTYANRLRTGLSVAAPNASPWTQSYGYDQLDRLTNVTSPAGAFGYYFGYNAMVGAIDPGSLIRRLSLPNGAYITNVYDTVARLTTTSLRNSSDVDLDREDYVYNLGNQRTQQVFTAGNYMNYTYDSIGELKTAFGNESGGVTNRMQERFSYVYDAAGNLNYRTNNTLLSQFNVNSLNELTTVTNGGRLTVAGTTTSRAASVTVNSVAATLYADASFASTNQSWVNGNNTYTAVATDSYGRTDSDVKTVTLQQTNTYGYDLNGNIVTNGPRVLDYDDENELIRITEPNTWKSEFMYDGKMRRRIRKEYTWNGSSWTQTNEVRYVYSGDLVIQERDGNNFSQVTYTRGVGLDAKLEGAGGIGSLLARTDMSSWAGEAGLANAFYHADGNGNITALIYTNQSMAARYEYDPYGNILSKSGGLANGNSYRFSSKEYESISGISSYLYRFYEPTLQRWLNMDPIDEIGFMLRVLGNRPSVLSSTDLEFGNSTFRPNIQSTKSTDSNHFAFVDNNPISALDPLGLFLGFGYGNWCGWSRSGPGNPIDGVDSACKKHDYCLATWADACKSKFCNMRLCADVAGADCNGDRACEKAKSKILAGCAVILVVPIFPLVTM
jgi:RHS repeat-associated protein